MNKYLFYEYPIQVSPSFFEEIGVNEAIFIQQLHYRLLKEQKELYIYKSSELLNAFFDKFYNIEQTLDDTAFYFQNLVEELDEKEKGPCVNQGLKIKMN